MAEKESWDIGGTSLNVADVAIAQCWLSQPFGESIRDITIETTRRNSSNCVDNFDGKDIWERGLSKACRNSFTYTQNCPLGDFWIRKSRDEVLQRR